MGNSTKDHVHAALLRLLKPIIRMMLRNSLTYKEFNQLSKQLFVEVAAEDFGIRGRPTNTSRISMLTGIDRKEIKRIKALLDNHQMMIDAQNNQDTLTRILSGWHADPAYLDKQGRPIALSEQGDTPSFDALAKQYGGNVPVSALLKEMLKSGVIARSDDDKLHALKRYYFPVQTDPTALLRAGDVMHDMGATLFHNLYVGKVDTEEPLRFERRATNRQISPTAVPEFKAFLAKHGQAFLVLIDNWLSEHESSQEDGVRLGVGTYLIEDDASEKEKKQ